jgi:ferredoxin-NADP reductase
VRHVIPATPRTRIISLDFSATTFAFAAGQAVMLGLHRSPLRKPYSIASAPWELSKTGTLQVLAQVEDSGGLDPHLELAAPGTQLDLEGPFGSFGVPVEAIGSLLFVAGGTGIAPLRSMLIEFAFRAELDALSAAGRLKAYFTVTREGSWEGRRGRIDEALLREALPSSETVCLVCGPPQLVSDTSSLLRRLGVSDDRILLEKY